VTAITYSLDDLAKRMNGTNGNYMTEELKTSNRRKDNMRFSSVWIATAGMDRPGMRERVKAILSPMIGLDERMEIIITNDVDLLAAAMVRHPEIPSSIVLIAGTGSIAMRYSIDHEALVPNRIARSGGWGHLLGDEGAGYSIGREAIRHALCSIDEFHLGLKNTPPTPLVKGIISLFNDSSALPEEGSLVMDLLTQVLVGGDDQLAKSRIARAAQIVLNASEEGDDEASEILSTQVSALIDGTLSRLLNPQSYGYVHPSRCGIILAGGALLHREYQNLFHSRLAAKSIKFAYIETVSNAALMGVEYLLKNY
jgi:N-acetylmuramic acid 6-phosphate etherase